MLATVFNFHGLLSVLHAAAQSLRYVRSELAPGWLSPLRPPSRDTSLSSPAIGEENSWKNKDASGCYSATFSSYIRH